LFDADADMVLEVDAEAIAVSTEWLEVDDLDTQMAPAVRDRQLAPELTDVSEAFDDWLRDSRAAVDRRLIGHFLDAAARYEAEGAVQDAIDALDGAVRIEPFREDLLRRIMALLAGVGRGAEAVIRYDQFATYLGEELGVAPDEDTAQLRDKIHAAIALGSDKKPTPYKTGRHKSGRPSVNVLSFENLTGEARLTPLGRMLAEDVVEKLSRFRLLSGIEFQPASSVGGNDAAPGRWRSHYALLGNLSLREGQVHMVLRLVDTNSGHHVWIGRESGAREALLDASDTAVDRLVASAAEAIRIAEYQELLGGPDGEYDAWDNFQRGM